MLRSLLSLLLICCVAPGGAGAATVTVDFTITMPNGSYPTLGEYWEGTITNEAKAVSRMQLGGHPTGHRITAVTGTRSVWTSQGGELILFHPPRVSATHCPTAFSCTH
jgi:hypothetical protein